MFITDNIKVLYAEVLPKLKKNENTRINNSTEDEKEKDRLIATMENIQQEIFQQELTTSQPSATWPSDHFLIYSLLEIQ
jgi:hypothetical protein